MHEFKKMMSAFNVNLTNSVSFDFMCEHSCFLAQEGHATVGRRRKRCSSDTTRVAMARLATKSSNPRWGIEATPLPVGALYHIYNGDNIFSIFNF